MVVVVILHGCMASIQARRGGGATIASYSSSLAAGMQPASQPASQRVRAGGITASSGRPSSSVQWAARSQHIHAHSCKPAPVQHRPTSSILPSITSVYYCVNTPPASRPTPQLRPRQPARALPASDEAAQPATMKPVVSAFNAWTWYVASSPRHSIPGTCARAAAATKTTR